jgi:hypothetical protein
MTSNAIATSRKTPVHLWIVGALALVWNAMGAFDYLATKLELEFYMSQFTPEQLEYFYGFPAWAVAAWALGVWCAFAGSIGLLLRQAWSRWAFAVSLAGMAISSVYTLALSGGAAIMGTAGIVMSVIIWVIGILLLVYAFRQTKNGVLR